jgi:hypothetical protein
MSHPWPRDRYSSQGHRRGRRIAPVAIPGQCPGVCEQAGPVVLAPAARPAPFAGLNAVREPSRLNPLGLRVRLPEVGQGPAQLPT